MHIFAVIFVLVIPGVQGLWPIPRSLQTGSTALRLAEDFDIRLTVQSPPEDLLEAVSRTKSQLVNDKLQVINTSL
jgi:hexosaminidase